MSGELLPARPIDSADELLNWAFAMYREAMVLHRNTTPRQRGRAYAEGQISMAGNLLHRLSGVPAMDWMSDPRASADYVATAWKVTP